MARGESSMSWLIVIGVELVCDGATCPSWRGHCGAFKRKNKPVVMELQRGQRSKWSDQLLESLVGMFARSQTTMQEYGVVTKVSANKKGPELLLDAKVFY